MSISMKNVVVFVTDLGRAKSFYADQLGLPLAGETQMLLEFFPATGTTLRVSGIEKLCERLKGSGVTFVEDLEVSPWGKMAVIADPDGNQFALVELPDALR